MSESISYDLLLVARDWRTRAYTLAELKERGHEVTAVPGVKFAIEVLERGQLAPPVVILDVHDDPDASPAAVDRLLALAPGKPLVLIVGVHQRSSWERVGREAAAWLIRPVSIGDVVAAVERLIGR